MRPPVRQGSVARFPSEIDPRWPDAETRDKAKGSATIGTNEQDEKGAKHENDDTKDAKKPRLLTAAQAKAKKIKYKKDKAIIAKLRNTTNTKIEKADKLASTQSEDAEVISQQNRQAIQLLKGPGGRGRKPLRYGPSVRD